MADTGSPVLTVAQRRRFTGEAVLRLLGDGALGQGRVELLDGEIWDVPSEGAKHGRLAVWLNRALVLAVAGDVAVACERTIRLSDTHWPEPDFALFPASKQVDEVRGPDLLLVIEIADTSLADDLKIKGPKYREFGVREYWVVDLEARETHVHRLDGEWPQTRPIPFHQPLKPTLAPNVVLTLADSGV
jgi:Uma2 family endonuclease